MGAGAGRLRRVRAAPTSPASPVTPAAPGDTPPTAGIQVQFHVIEDMHGRVTTLQKELDEMRLHRDMLLEQLRTASAGEGPRRGRRDVLWNVLRRTWRKLPLRDDVRERAKARFYRVYGRVRPRSPRYLAWRAVHDNRSAAAARQGPAAFVPPVPPVPPGPRTWDVLVFPIIDWNFRHQRPQHLALELASRGHRVFYFETTFANDLAMYDPSPRPVAHNVWVCQLPCHGTPPVIYEQALSDDQVAAVLHGLRLLREKVSLGATVALVDHPFWQPVAEQLPNNVVVYDCMDHHGGFANTASFVHEYERRALERSDLVLATSAPLAATVARSASRHVLLRNACEYEHFAAAPEGVVDASERKVAGYYGAIAQWFDAELLADVARRLPHVDFRLVGASTGADLSPIAGLANVSHIGEVSYQELPRHLHAFDVCLIPFKVVELTRCTNPVKVYEYLSAGKPVVSVPLPEVELMSTVVRTADGAEAFAAAIEEALAEDDPALVEHRREFARENTWVRRGKRLESEIDPFFPKISVIVLTYNELQFTKACLDSLRKFTDYPEWELILVDNGSSDATPEYLAEYARDKDHVRVILNGANLGFAAGNNVGAEAATGEYIVFLNNDTYVTRGWLGDLLAHFRADPSLGILGPVTNNIGNEARIKIAYRNMEEMHRRAYQHTRERRGRRFDLAVCAFFCVMIPRDLWELAGPLDERFGMGFFEDDDYAMRIRQQGYTVQCAEDVFIHHHLSASFDKLPQDARSKLFLENKTLWESKWGPWKPHEYREEHRDGPPAATVQAAGGGSPS